MCTVGWCREVWNPDRFSLKICKAISKMIRPILGLFALTGMYFLCWIYTWQWQFQYLGFYFFSSCNTNWNWWRPHLEVGWSQGLFYFDSIYSQTSAEFTLHSFNAYTTRVIASYLSHKYLYPAQTNRYDVNM